MRGLRRPKKANAKASSAKSNVLRAARVQPSTRSVGRKKDVFNNLGTIARKGLGLSCPATGRDISSLRSWLFSKLDTIVTSSDKALLKPQHQKLCTVLRDELREATRDKLTIRWDYSAPAADAILALCYSSDALIALRGAALALEVLPKGSRQPVGVGEADGGGAKAEAGGGVTEALAQLREERRLRLAAEETLRLREVELAAQAEQLARTQRRLAAVERAVEWLVAPGSPHGSPHGSPTH